MRNKSRGERKRTREIRRGGWGWQVKREERRRKSGRKENLTGNIK